MNRVADRPAQDKDANLPVERIGGRYVTQYNPEIALQIVERIAQGETLSKICEKGSGFPHPVTFKRWVVNNPELAKALGAAKKLSAQSLEEEALDAAREIKSKQRDGTQVRAFEVLLQQLRWSAERRDPELYGSHASVAVRVPISIHTSLDMNKANNEGIDDKGIYTITASKRVSPTTAIRDADEIVIEQPLVQGEKRGQEPFQREETFPIRKHIRERGAEQGLSHKQRRLGQQKSGGEGNGQGPKPEEEGDQ